MSQRTAASEPGPADLAAAGLSTAQVAERVAAGQVNDQGQQPTRTVGQILLANIATRFNAVLGGLFVVIAVVGPLQDGLFGLVLVANSGVGIVQELRAKRTLDRLTVLNAPTATVLRDGVRAQIPAALVVLDDVLELGPGDQVVADGVVLTSAGLEIDESLLSGEADPVGKQPGADARSGSFVVAGSGRITATAVGPASYAARLAAQARSYSPARSEIRDAINLLLKWISWLLVPVGVLLVVRQLQSGQSVAEALRGSVAGLVGMVPEGLVLLTSVAMAVGVVRLAARKVLVQDLPAIEGLARVDVVCCDKTGTLTRGSMRVVSVISVGDGADPGTVRAAEPALGHVEAALGALAVADPRPNATMRAIADGFADPGWRPSQVTAFSSARKWSAASYDGQGTWVIGSPEMILTGGGDRGGGGDALDQAGQLAADGYRVLLLARADALPDGQRLPGQVQPVALVTLEEQLRPEAQATLDYFASQGVSVRVLSGDHPATAGAIARRLGLPGADAGHVLDARKLPGDAAELAAVVRDATVIGRVTPQQKRAIVRTLQASGHVVAMTGDGVNDVLALKDSDVGIAMGSGTPASRGVARLVLLDDSFATLPGVVAEGRRIIGNVDRVSRLFLTKTSYAVLIALAVAAIAVPYPFYPRHLTIISTLAIGVPAFFLALAPSAERVSPGFLGRALRFAVPAGLIIAAATFAAFLSVRAAGIGLGAARTSATIAAVILSLFVLAALCRPLSSWRGAMVLALAAVFAALFTLPWLRGQLALVVLPAHLLALTVGIAAVGCAALLLAWPAARRVFSGARPDRAMADGYGQAN
ncbi:MAG TPA: HAD-IC family P-type ATPase [Streptosporangiaceae bacterium]|nr:HAD-IC family P-type ATPase [Streptosporangiaceae bacterium]